ncbi:MAG: DUF3467 domain-containing protein [Paludibacteraceae bacterium]|nr:DUF3467 domain-containing protein [Paludibacteraceae bacterium]
METKKQELQIEVTPEVADGVYSNLAVISHSTSEFIVDFLIMTPGAPKAKVKSRVLMTPENAKRLMVALRDNIVKYESQFGEINMNKGAALFPVNKSLD